MKPPGLNLCADTRRYKYLRASQRVKTERDLHWVEVDFLKESRWLYDGLIRIGCRDGLPFLPIPMVTDYKQVMKDRTTGSQTFGAGMKDVTCRSVARFRNPWPNKVPKDRRGPGVRQKKNLSSVFPLDLPTNTVRGRGVRGVACYLWAMLSSAGGQCQKRFVRAVPTDGVSYLWCYLFAWQW